MTHSWGPPESWEKVVQLSIDILQEHSTMRKKKINQLQTMTRGQMEAEISKALISF
jgi:hypothetical protein